MIKLAYVITLSEYMTLWGLGIFIALVIIIAIFNFFKEAGSGIFTSKRNWAPQYVEYHCDCGTVFNWNLYRNTEEFRICHKCEVKIYATDDENVVTFQRVKTLKKAYHDDCYVEKQVMSELTAHPELSNYAAIFTISDIPRLDDKYDSKELKRRDYQDICNAIYSKEED